ncbi:MAG: carbohydrate-binding family 9-like protein [Oscillospiraceae bacterium]|nr:carbohydrate-binding family 9-like protein [Oscillospiraceae bacterium]
MKTLQNKGFYDIISKKEREKMDKEYIMQKTSLKKDDHIDWEDIEEANINENPWGFRSCAPSAGVKGIACESGFRFLLYSCEKDLRTEAKNESDDIESDSCIGIFLNPSPDVSEEYISIEINPCGTVKSEVGVRNRRKFAGVEILEIKELPEAEAGVEIPWGAEIFVPYSAIDKIYGKTVYNSGKVMLGNFYKCRLGGERSYCSCWNAVETGRPELHHPEFFGEIIIF